MLNVVMLNVVVPILDLHLKLLPFFATVSYFHPSVTFAGKVEAYQSVSFTPSRKSFFSGAVAFKPATSG
jgi:hypothetical protein